jgi:hypothetical protein
VIVQRSHDLEAGEHAIDTVEFPAVRLCIEMAPGGDCRGLDIAACATRVDVAYVVDGDGAPGFLAPLDEEIAPFSVERTQRQTAAASMIERADTTHGRDGLPKPLRLNAVSHPFAHSLTSG